MKTRHLLSWTTAAALLSGCGSAGGSPAGDDLDGLRRQAHAALARYDQAVRDAGATARFVPVGELTRQLGDWEPANGVYKESLAAGRVEATVALPTTPAPTGNLVWANGTKQSVTLISADEALAQLRTASTGECAGCPPLKVTAARLTTMTVSTTRGPATAPAWEYTLDGTATRLLRLAAAPSSAVRVMPPSWRDDHPQGGPPIESATTTTSSRELTVTFTGAPDSRSRPCGADYTTEPVESDLAIVVIVIEHPHAEHESCGDVGARRTATVALARPLGERAVLDVQQGLPVPLTIR